VTSPAARPRLSFCLPTRGAPGRVRHLLALLRPIADEVVLAVDASGDTSVLASCRELYDRGVTYSGAPPAARILGFVYAQCTGDWIFRLDDDEVPSAALLARLPELVEDRRVSAFSFRRRWLWPRSDAYLASNPWTPDFSRRLVRNVTGLFSFRGVLHHDAEVVGETRHLAEAIYHADLLLSSREVRSLKASLYDRFFLPAGGRSNALYYVPEERPRLETRPVPEADREAIRTLLESSAPVPSIGGPGGARHASFREVSLHNERRVVSPEGRRGRVRLSDVPGTAEAGQPFYLDFEVSNDGNEPWPPGDREPGIRVGLCWRRDAETSGEGSRVRFSETVLPGASVLVPASVVAPAVPGRWRLEAGLVHEWTAWFGDSASTEVEVLPTLQDRRAPQGETRAARFAWCVREGELRGLGRGEIARQVRPWLRSHRPGADPIRDATPWLTTGAVPLLSRAVASGATVLEWGAGGSTLFFLRAGAILETVEHEPSWADRVRREVARLGGESAARWNLHVVLPEENPETIPGDPTNCRDYRSGREGEGQRQFESYVRVAEQFAAASFDVVLVDGRARSSCLVAAAPLVRPGGLLALDDSDRERYAVAVATLDPAEWARTDVDGPRLSLQEFGRTTVWTRVG
jgi:hypothetical protein